MIPNTNRRPLSMHACPRTCKHLHTHAHTHTYPQKWRKIVSDSHPMRRLSSCFLPSHPLPVASFQEGCCRGGAPMEDMEWQGQSLLSLSSALGSRSVACLHFSEKRCSSGLGNHSLRCFRQLGPPVVFFFRSGLRQPEKLG